MKQRHYKLTWIAMPLIVLAMTMAGSSAWAQTPDTVKVNGQDVHITFEDGRVVVNGKALENDGGTVVLEPDEAGGVVVFRSGPDRRWIERWADRRVHRSDVPGAMAFRFNDDFDPLDMHELKPHVGFFDDDGMMGFWRGDMEGPLQEHTEIARMNAESRRLARRVREAEGEEREQLEHELDDLLDDIFDRKLALRSERMERLEAELAEQRQRYEERQAARDEIIQRRKRELLGEPDVLDW